MSARYTQSKAEATAHTQILKAMLQRPENKLCADCKRNDPRWASTNLGCFMCIRCSGIHRGMGVHITRIKSVDLDTWSPEQIVNIQRWGNRRANAYWEAHLKAGHAPPEHKLESFIRSKYESRRWAMDGPLPDPETLDGEGFATTPTATTSAPAPLSARLASTAAKTTSRSPVDLLAGPPSSSRSAPAPAVVSTSTPPPAPAPSAGGGLFDLDFSAPPPAPAPRKDAKADILSLFASAPPPQYVPPQQQQQQQQQSGLVAGLGGLSLGGAPASQGWGQPAHGNGASSNGGSGGGFGDFEAFGAPPAAKPSSDPFASSSNVWGGSTQASSDPFGDFSNGGAGGTTSNNTTSSGSKDVFSDIWA